MPLPAILLELRVDLVDQNVLLQGHVRVRRRRVDPHDRVFHLRQLCEVTRKNAVDPRIAHVYGSGTKFPPLPFRRS